MEGSELQPIHLCLEGEEKGKIGRIILEKKHCGTFEHEGDQDLRTKGRNGMQWKQGTESWGRTKNWYGI